MQIYEDQKVKFNYPESLELEASEENGQYSLVYRKEIAVLMSILPRAEFPSRFEQLAKYPSPQANRTKTVHRGFVLGGKHGNAFEWNFFDARNKSTMWGLEFFWEIGQWSAKIEVYIYNSADRTIAEEIVRSLQLKKKS